jgi:regulator of replication initiation timing
VQEIHNLELYQRVLSLHSDIIEIVEENNRLRDENKDLKNKLALQKQMVFNEPFYFQESAQTPYCPACWEGSFRPVHVTFVFDNNERTRWDCPNCKHTYLIEKIGRPAAPRGY